MPKTVTVALRKESVDRNVRLLMFFWLCGVALRKESVDRNRVLGWRLTVCPVALRKESVDRNNLFANPGSTSLTSLSARRAWIEMDGVVSGSADYVRRSPQGERG